MKSKDFIKNIEKLSSRLNLPNPLKVSDTLSVSFVVNHSTPLLVNISYDPAKGKVILNAPLSFSIPESLEGLQAMMIKLFSDLIIREKKIGTLSANPERTRLDFTKELELKEGEGDFLAEFTPLFIDEAFSWREKIHVALNEKKRQSCLEEEEILNFNFKVS